MLGPNDPKNHFCSLAMLLAASEAVTQANICQSTREQQLSLLKQQTCVLDQPVMPAFSITQPSETYLYGGWHSAPQACCTSGPEKTNCKNCGASLRGRYRCEYCGTVNN